MRGVVHGRAVVQVVPPGCRTGHLPGQADKCCFSQRPPSRGCGSPAVPRCLHALHDPLVTLPCASWHIPPWPPPSRRLLPEPDRHGTRFVFRSGSPLMPDDLRMVAACRWTRGMCITLCVDACAGGAVGRAAAAPWCPTNCAGWRRAGRPGGMCNQVSVHVCEGVGEGW